jgi:hypothetical protein
VVRKAGARDSLIRASFGEEILTIGIAWVGERKDGRQHLYMATDSRTRGAKVMDFCPKIVTLPRSDCALCFAGNTFDTYPMMIQLSYAIAAHGPANDRSIDVGRVNDHLLKIFDDLVHSLKDSVEPFDRSNATFIFAGFSWLQSAFRIWKIQFDTTRKLFVAHECRSFIPRLPQVAFIGDWSLRVQRNLAKHFSKEGPPLYLEPLPVLANMLAAAGPNVSIGGPPQLIRITQSMNTRPFCVSWNGKDTLFGRELFDYENVDYWKIDPFSLRVDWPRNFGRRSVGDGEDRKTSGMVE